MPRPKLLFFAGSMRSASLNRSLAQNGAILAAQDGIDATFLDLKEYELPLYDGDFEDSSGVPDNAVRLKDVIEAHDGVFIVCPEYNSAITPLLKNTLDWVSRVKNTDGSFCAVFKNKPTAIGAVSPGSLGGMRVLANLRPILSNGYNALVIPEQISVPFGNKAFSDDGTLTDSKLVDRYKSVITSLRDISERML